MNKLYYLISILRVCYMQCCSTLTIGNISDPCSDISHKKSHNQSQNWYSGHSINGYCITICIFVPNFIQLFGSSYPFCPSIPNWVFYTSNKLFGLSFLALQSQIECFTPQINSLGYLFLPFNPKLSVLHLK